MEINTVRKENGKLQISMRRNTNATLRPGSHDEFKINRENIFLSEYKVNHPREKKRAFNLSIRLDGHLENQGQTILSQISLDKEDLLQLREQIDTLLNDEEM